MANHDMICASYYVLGGPACLFATCMHVLLFVGHVSVCPSSKAT